MVWPEAQLAIRPDQAAPEEPAVTQTDMRAAAAVVVAALPEIRQRGALVLMVVIMSQILRGVLADTVARVILPAVVLAAQAAVETQV